MSLWDQLFGRDEIDLVLHEGYADITLEDALKNDDALRALGITTKANQVWVVQAYLNYYSALALAKQVGLPRDDPQVKESDTLFYHGSRESRRYAGQFVNMATNRLIKAVYEKMKG